MAAPYAQGCNVAPLFIAGNVPALRGVASNLLVAGCEARLSPYQVCVWSNTSTATDDGLTVVCPSDITSPAPGRWLIGTPSAVQSSTSGSATQVVASKPLPSGSVATMRFDVAGTDGTFGMVVQDSPATGYSTIGNSGTYIGPMPVGQSAFPIEPKLNFSWASGLLSLSVSGPQATVTATSSQPNSGPFAAYAGMVLITVSARLSGSITGDSLTLSGFAGTTACNGVHTDTLYVGANQFLLTSTAFVSADSSGTVLETVLRNIAWSGNIDLPTIAA